MKNLIRQAQKKSFPEELIEKIGSKKELVKKDSVFHPSSTLCVKKEIITRNLRNLTSVIDYKSRMNMEIGKAIHIIMQKYLVKFGYTISKNVERSFTLDGIKGTCDAIVKRENKKYIWELKTTNYNGWSKLKRPYNNHIVQNMLYQWAFEVHQGLIWYLNKGKEKSHEDDYKVKEFRIKYDEGVVEKVKKDLEQVDILISKKSIPVMLSGTSQCPDYFCSLKILCNEVRAWGDLEALCS